jgi:hypothetical protein
MSSTSPSKGPKMHNTPPSDFGWNLNQTLNQLIGFADFKGAALLGAAGVILTLFLQSKPTLSPGNILAVVFLVLCALCAGYAFLPFLPFRCRENKENPVFWKSIRGKWKSNQGKEVEYVEYKVWVSELNDFKVNDYYAQENREISKDLMHRFVAIELSIVFLIVGLFFVAIHFLTTK